VRQPGAKTSTSAWRCVRRQMGMILISLSSYKAELSIWIAIGVIERLDRWRNGRSDWRRRVRERGGSNLVVLDGSDTVVSQGFD
jgi:hypothetical protein